LTVIFNDLHQISNNVVDVTTEKCYHIEIEANTQLSPADVATLKWILKNPQDPDNLLAESQFAGASSKQWCIEIGPRFNFSTADSTNSVSICQNVGLKQIVRIETSVKYLVSFDGDKNEAEHAALLVSQQKQFNA
jgi:phosphoribosylformylglycinamidine synthase